MPECRKRASLKKTGIFGLSFVQGSGLHSISESSSLLLRNRAPIIGSWVIGSWTIRCKRPFLARSFTMKPWK